MPIDILDEKKQLNVWYDQWRISLKSEMECHGCASIIQNGDELIFYCRNGYIVKVTVPGLMETYRRIGERKKDLFNQQWTILEQAGFDGHDMVKMYPSYGVVIDDDYGYKKGRIEGELYQRYLRVQKEWEELDRQIAEIYVQARKTAAIRAGLREGKPRYRSRILYRPR